MKTLTVKKFKKNDLRKTLKTLIENSSITLSLLSRNTGVPVTTLSRLISGEHTNPTISSLTPIAEFFAISIGQLIGDEPLSVNETIGAYVENRNFWTTVPIIPWDKIREFISMQEVNDLHFLQGTVLSEILLGHKSYALTVENNDWDYFSSGTILIVDQEAIPKNRDFIVVIQKDQEIPILKQLLIDENGDKYLKPMNSSFKIIEFSDSYEIIGVMKQARKDY